jgi:nucleoside-diphosphate-sugar epimerase
MKIVITGSNGFIGSYLCKYYSEYGHHVIPLNRSVCNLENEQSVNRFFSDYPNTVVVHTALWGREFVRDNNPELHERNWTIWQNLVSNRDKFQKFINIGSGLEYDSARDIKYADEDDILYVEPTMPYDRVKNDISRAIHNLPNFYTLRLFGIAHYSEGNRFFNRLLNEPTFTISEDREYDYFNLEDLPQVIDLILDNKIQHKDINCVYKQKYKLSDLAKLFCDIKGLDYNKVTVENTSSKNYTGSFFKIDSYNLPFLGIELAMLRY